MRLRRVRLSPSSPVEVDMIGLGLVTEACLTLVSKGASATSLDELWKGDLLELKQLLEDEAAFNASRIAFQRLKQASHALARLQVSLDTKIFFMKGSIETASLHHGLLSLPCEVLERVISYCVDLAAEDPVIFNPDVPKGKPIPDGPDAWESVRRLSLVNWSFRDLIYKMPACWSRIGFPNTRQKNERLLSMCNGSPRALNVSEGTALSLEELRRYATHITHVAVDMRFTEGVRHPESIFFPNLHSLQLADYEGREPAQIEEFFKSWSMPNLCSMVVDAAKLGRLPPNALARLTKLVVSTPFMADACETHALLKDLGSAASCKEVSLVLMIKGRARCEEDDDDDSSWDGSHSNIKFRRLVKLSISIEFSQAGSQDDAEELADIASEIIRHLQLPALRTLTLTFTHAKRDREAIFTPFSYLPVARLFPKHHSIPCLRKRLRTLSLDIQPYAKWEPRAEAKAFMVNMIKAFSRVRTLSIGGSLVDLRGVYRELARPRHLALHAWDADEFWMRDILAGVCSQKVVNLEEISITAPDGSKNGGWRERWKTDPSFWTAPSDHLPAKGRRTVLLS